MSLSLIGMSGVGKSTVGKVLAEKLGYQFIDIDKKLEDRFEAHLPHILETLGEEKFLKEESEEVQALPEDDRMVIASGGSIIYSDEAMWRLKQISKVVYLSAPSEWIVAHTTPGTRGIVGLSGRTFEKVHDERAPIYARAADLTVNVVNKSPEDIVEEIVGTIRG